MNPRKPSLDIKTPTIQEEQPQISVMPLSNNVIPENPTFPFTKRRQENSFAPKNLIGKLVEKKNRKITGEEFDFT